MRIIFMGTPEFAVASLDALLKDGFNIVAVVTGPDKPAGRGQKIHESEVKKFAVAKGLPVLQPLKLKDPVFLEQLRSYQADLQVVVAFRMLPEVVWNMPPLGTINLHASLLPDYRGAAPINWAVINGEKVTGVTTFLLQHEIDTGNILFSARVEIGEHETAGDLHDKLMKVGSRLLVETVKAMESGDYQPRPQEDLKRPATHAPKIFKDDCLINWHRPVQIVYNHIRGLSPYPTAFTHIHNKTLKIFKASPVYEKADREPGSFISDGKTFLRFACNDGWINVEELQIEGKKRMQVDEFLRGYRL